MKIIIKNGFVVNTESVVKCDLLVEDGIISAMGGGFEDEAATVIDASGKYVLPGPIDVHTHMDLQAGQFRAVDDFYKGSIAAACGGTTSIVDHIAFGPKGCTLQHQLDVYHGLADSNSVIDYGFHGVLQHVNEDILLEMENLMKNGIPSFKAYMTYDFKLSDDELLQVMKIVKKVGGVLTVHAENHEVINYLRRSFVEEGKTEAKYHASSRPPHTEAEAVSRLIHLSAMADYPNLYLVHISTEESLKEIIKAKENGAKNIFVETCIQYLLLTEDKYLLPEGEGLKYVMSPPLRKQKDCDALWKGIQKGIVQVVATDHCPFYFKDKIEHGLKNFTQCPNGGPGVEERVRVLFTEGVMKNRISIQHFVEIASYNPAKIMGIYPKKGNIQPGADADLILIDTEKTGVIRGNMLHGNAGYSLYEGYQYKGEIEMVMQRGKIIVSQGEFIGNRGDGEFLNRILPIL
ncbi:dihydropyrimidinase [Clostridium sp. PL3]|uniref:Dihydropyrimidinase n=1 Tax=Clostridium thailandense TaxID=2794346 RepID=A0A949U018_9CLOT|nr:dihydropyrimidinase [Clostridium thailandense]MBV7274951.1 dihydropyrimidinase [Clostridium thailandense]